MFRWGNARLKGLQDAIREGRVDEAYDRVIRAEIHKLSRHNSLVDELVRLLAARARVRASSGQLREALVDLEKLATLEKLDSDTTALHQRLQVEIAAREKRHKEDGAAYHRAAQAVDRGRLDSGRVAVDRLEDPQRREKLREELDIRLARASELLGQAQAALERNDVLAAARHWQDATQRHGRTAELDAFLGALVARLRTTLDDWLGKGQLERLRHAVDSLSGLVTADPSLEEYANAVAVTQRANRQLLSADFVGLRDTLLRLRSARRDAGWIPAALDAVDRVLAGRDELLACPIGSMPSARGAAPAQAAEGAQLALVENQARTRQSVLALIDGAGSALLLPSERVTIGRAGGSADPLLPLPADLQSHHADIIYDGEDYYLVAHGPARLNQRSVSRARLRSGDRIVLGGSAKMIFERPSAKSDTAVLRLSDRTRAPQDVSVVALFRGELVIGPEASCHVRTREGQSRVVLFERDGGLWARLGNDHAGGPATPVTLRETRDFGDVRLTVKLYEARETPGTF